jgi:Tol biopolymer transport system component
VFASRAANLTGSSPANTAQIFRHDAQTGQLQRVSANIGGSAGNAESYNAEISADGRRVAFIAAAAGNITPQDIGRGERLYRFDADNDSYRALTYFNRPDTAYEITRLPRFSTDGESIGFVSSRSDLADDGNSNVLDVFVVYSYGDPIFADGFQQ